jgi:hypothetical protein
VQGLDVAPEPGLLLEVVPHHLDVLGDQPLNRGATTIEQVVSEGPGGSEYAIEVSYEGSCAIEESTLEDPTQLDDALAPLGQAVASVLVRISDLPFVFRPVETPQG